MNGIAIGIGLLIIMAGVAMGFTKSPMTTTCTASPYKSVVFTGQVSDSTTGVGIASAVVIWADPPYSNSQFGTQTGSTGSYWAISSGAIPQWRGCDSVEVSVYKVASNYVMITQIFQLPDNSCYPVNMSCNSVTIGANYALVPASPLVAAFTYSATGLTVSFTDKSTGSPNAWSWTFGDACGGSPCSTVQSPTHTYTLGGTYTVTLTAYRSTPSATSTVSQSITISLGQNNQGTTPPPSCPTGYTGTYPNCIPPANNQNQSNTTTNKTVNQPGNINAYNVTPLQILVLFAGVAVVAVGIAWKSGRRN